MCLNIHGGIPAASFGQLATFTIYEQGSSGPSPESSRAGKPGRGAPIAAARLACRGLWSHIAVRRAGGYATEVALSIRKRAC